MDGFINLFAAPLGYILEFLYGLIGNYGLSIMALTFIVKAALYPLYLKQIKSTAKMGDFRPQMQDIQRKYAHDKTLMNQKMSELYKEEGINPAAGCLPILIQMPIIFGLFSLLRDPKAVFEGNEEMIFASHESFLWVADLSQPDIWILPILAGIGTFIAFSQTSKHTMAGMDGQPGMGGMAAMMKYFFPVMIVLMARNFAAGLALYWFFGQVVQILFNFHLNKVRREMKEEQAKKKKNKK